MPSSPSDDPAAEYEEFTRSVRADLRALPTGRIPGPTTEGMQTALGAPLGGLDTGLGGVLLGRALRSWWRERRR